MNDSKNKKYLDNLLTSIKEDWQTYHKYYKEKNSFGVQNRLFSMVSKYCSTGILSYLLDGDRSGFFQLFYNAALTYDLHNDYCNVGMPHEKMTYSLSDPRGFFAGLLSMGQKQAQRLSLSMYNKCRYSEDEFHFCFIYSLSQMMLPEQTEVHLGNLKVLTEFKEEGREADIEIGIFEGLLYKDEDKFVETIGKYLNRRENQIKKNDDVNIGEEYISIEGLGIIRLAQDIGINVQINHRLTPLELQTNYPSIDLLSENEIPAPKKEIDDPEFWKDWKAVESVL